MIAHSIAQWDQWFIVCSIAVRDIKSDDVMLGMMVA